jgi:hypothetical protein
VNPISAILFWSAMFWREEADSIAVLALAERAKRLGDEVGKRRHFASARVAEGRIVALVRALEAFCIQRNVELATALAVVGIDHFKPAFDVDPDADYQRSMETALAKIATARHEVQS